MNKPTLKNKNLVLDLLWNNFHSWIFSKFQK